MSWISFDRRVVIAGIREASGSKRADPPLFAPAYRALAAGPGLVRGWGLLLTRHGELERGLSRLLG